MIQLSCSARVQWPRLPDFRMLTSKCRQQQNFDSDPKEAWHYNYVTFTPIAQNFMLYCRLIYMFSMLYVRLTIKVKVGIPESDFYLTRGHTPTILLQPCMTLKPVTSSAKHIALNGDRMTRGHLMVQRGACLTRLLPMWSKKNERKEKETFHTDLKRVKKNSLPGECSITRRQSFFST